MTEPLAGDAERIDREARDWVVRLASGEATQADADAFRAWCARSRAHAVAFSRARRVWQDLRQVTPSGSGVQASGMNLRPRRFDARRRALLGGALAASGAWLMLRPPMQLWPSVMEWGADYRTGPGEQREIVLAGVVVQMNTRTRINLRRDVAATSLELVEGEAGIGHRADDAGVVRVEAGRGRVEGESARFNVRYTDGEACVTCLSGRVRIEREQQTVWLEPGLQLVYGERGLGQPEVAQAGALAWRQRLLVFDDAPLSLVIAEINRYRRGRLILMRDDLAGKRVQASFSIDRLEDAVALIQDLYGAELTHLPGGVVLLG